MNMGVGEGVDLHVHVCFCVGKSEGGRERTLGERGKEIELSASLCVCLFTCVREKERLCACVHTCLRACVCVRRV